MTDLFDRLAAKAAGLGEAAVMPAPAWGPGLVEDVQTVVVPPMPRAMAKTVLPVPVSAAPLRVMPPVEPARHAAHDAPRTTDAQPVQVTEVQVLSPAPSQRTVPVMEPQGQSVVPEAQARVMPAIMRDRAVPAPAMLVPIVQAAPLVAPPAMTPPAVLQPVPAVAEAAAIPKAAPPAAQQPVPAVPDIRIRIGHIRVTAPQAAPVAAPAFAAPHAPKGQALKAYLGWRR